MVDVLVGLAALLAGLAFLLGLWRFWVGPSAADRVVAFDALTIVAVSGIVLIAYLEDRAIYLDVALVYALLSFLGVIAVARYLDRGGR